MVEKTFKYRIYPTKEQEKFLANQFGSARFIFNYFLNERKNEYLNNGKSSNYYDNAKTLTSLKENEKYIWLNEINSQSLQASLRNLEVAYTNFFSKRAKFPKFKSRKNDQCVKIPQHFYIEDKLLYIPKLKTGIKINLHTALSGKVVCCFIRKTCTNKYYVSIFCETEAKKLERNENKIGIDVGIKTLITTNTGETFNNPKTLKQYEKELKYLQRQLSKKKKGSNKSKKARIRLALVHEKIKNIRNDNIHKITKKLINENQVIISESLSVVNMMKDHCLAKSISDCAWGEIFRQLNYKSNWYDRTYFQIDKFFPSSKMCNKCKFIVDELPLNIREWVCPNCGERHDRDINAAKNILEKGLKDLSGSGTESDIKQKSGEAPSLERSLNREVHTFMWG